MTITTTANLSANISWVQQETNSLTLISDIGSVLADPSLSNGTGLRSCDAVWHDVRTLPSGSSESFRLSSLTRTLFSEEGDMSFNRVRGIIVKNQAEEAGLILSVAVTGSDAFDEPFNGGSGNVQVQPLCAFPIMNYIVGWEVTASHRAISIFNNSNSGITYEIAVVGVTGVS